MATCVGYVAITGKVGINNVVITPSQVLAPVTGDPATCGMVLIDGNEYSSLLDIANNGAKVALDISDAVALLLQAPPETALGQAFLLGFTVPVSAYLVAYLVGLLVSMFDK